MTTQATLDIVKQITGCNKISKSIHEQYKDYYRLDDWKEITIEQEDELLSKGIRLDIVQQEIKLKSFSIYLNYYKFENTNHHDIKK